MPGAGRAGRRQRAMGGAGAAAEHGRETAHQRVLDLLRADEVDMAVEAAGGNDLAFARDDLGAGADDDRLGRVEIAEAGLDVGIAGLADGADAPGTNADIGFHDAPMIEDQRVGDDGIDRAVGVPDLRLAHAVADDLAAAELDLLAIGGEILLDLDDEFGVAEPHRVAGGGAEHRGIGVAREGKGHGGLNRSIDEFNGSATEIPRCSRLRGRTIRSARNRLQHLSCRSTRRSGRSRGARPDRLRV